jgi:hypothetical protein
VPTSDRTNAALDAVAKAVEDAAGRQSIASDPRTVEEIVNDLLTIASNARSGMLGVDRRVDPHCGYTPANCPYGDACADCEPEDEIVVMPERVIHNKIAERLRVAKSRTDLGGTHDTPSVQDQTPCPPPRKS